MPEYNPTVRVEGAVNSPTSVLYRQGAGLGYYIANAGGYAHNADKGSVSVRYANGTAAVVSKFLFFKSSPKPGPGSQIIVPAKPPGVHGPGFATVLTSIVGVASTLTTFIVVLAKY